MTVGSTAGELRTTPSSEARARGLVANELCVSSWSLARYLGPITVPWRAPDGRKVLRVIGSASPTMDLLDLPGLVRQELGIDCLEICQFHLPEKTPAYIDELRAALVESGMSLVDMPIDVGNIADPDKDHRKQDEAEIEEWIEVAAALGSRMVRVNVGPVLPVDGPLASLRTIIDGLRTLADSAHRHGLQMVLENHGGVTAEPSACVRIIQEVGPHRLSALADTGNFDPVRAEVLEAERECREYRDVEDQKAALDGLALIAPYTALVHAKCHGFWPDGRSKVYDFDRALRVLRDSGYSGPVSVEYETARGDSGERETWANLRRALLVVRGVFSQ